jgi:putative ABC transport system permease protein
VRFNDVLWLSLSALYQQKARTLLTTLGVLLGTHVLIVSLAVGRGVQNAVQREFARHGQLRKIEVWPGVKPAESEIPAAELAVHGDMSDEKRERIRQTIIRRWNWKNLRRPRVPLDQERIKALAKIEHVVSVVPYAHDNCRIHYETSAEEVVGFGAAQDNRLLRDRLLAGDFFSTDEGRFLLVHEYVLYLWGITRDEDVSSVLGKKVLLDYHTGRRTPYTLLNLLGGPSVNVNAEENRVLLKAIKQLPAALASMNFEPKERETLERVLGNLPGAASPADKPITEEFTIVGVFREPGKDERIITWGAEWLSRDADVVLPAKTAQDLFFRVPRNAENGFELVSVKVDDEAHIKEVSAKIKDMGLEQFSLEELVDRVQMNLILLTFATGFVATVSLLVASLGITNTMVMTVLERTHEIGVMKAVGARDSHIQLIFLVEGALIGVIGGLLGLLASWLASIPGDRVARSLMERYAEIKVDESMFVFPLWMMIGIPLFAAIVTTLAAVYPARRAARVNPITALRHE